MIFREFVQVGSCRPAARGPLQGNHRKLHHVLPGNQPVEELEFERMSDVLGIMEYDNFVANALPLFRQQHPLEDPVQAVRFIGRAWIGADDFFHLWKADADGINRILRGLVVRIRPDEDVKVFVIHALDGVRHHLVDYFVLVPRGNPDRGPFFWNRTKDLLPDGTNPVAKK